MILLIRRFEFVGFNSIPKFEFEGFYALPKIEVEEKMCCLTGIPLLETVYMMALCRWAWKRCLHTGSEDSKTWGTASFEDFEPVPRMCRLNLAVYEEDLDNPLWPPPGGYQLDTHCVVKRAGNLETYGMAPQYLIYIDHNAKDIVLAFRG